MGTTSNGPAAAPESPTKTTMGTLATGQNSQVKRVMERTALSSPGSNREFKTAVFNAGQAFDADANQSPTGVADLHD